MPGQRGAGCVSGMAFRLKLCCCATHFPGASCVASRGWLWDLGCFPGLRKVLWAGAVPRSLHAHGRGTATSLLQQSFLCSSLPPLQCARYPAQGEFWSTGQETLNHSEQGKDLVPNCSIICSRNRLQPVPRLAGRLCIESQCWPKSIDHRIKKNSESLSFFPFTLKRFMIYCCFLPFMVQKERSWREFQLWHIPRNRPLLQPGGTFDLTHCSNASPKLQTARAPTFAAQIPQHQATRASPLGTAGLSPAATLCLPPLAGAVLQRCCRPFPSREAQKKRDVEGRKFCLGHLCSLTVQRR